VASNGGMFFPNEGLLLHNSAKPETRSARTTRRNNTKEDMKESARVIFQQQGRLFLTREILVVACPKLSFKVEQQQQQQQAKFCWFGAEGRMM